MQRAKAIRPKLILLYGLAIHILMVILLFKTDAYLILRERIGLVPIEIESTDFYRKMVGYHRRQLTNVEDNTLVFLGDSMVHGLNVSSLSPNALNLGIGGDTVSAMTKRVQSYPELQKAKGVVVGIGINSIGYRSTEEITQEQKGLMNEMDSLAIQLWLAILPTSQSYSENKRKNLAEIEHVNTDAERICDTIRNCHFLRVPPDLLASNGYLNENVHSDGIHLNRLGYAIWQAAIKNALEGLPKSATNQTEEGPIQ